MTPALYCACVRGQLSAFGSSVGIDDLARQILATGVPCDVFDYTDAAKLDAAVRARRAAGDRIVLVGYSLGDTTITWAALYEHIDLLVAIYESSLGQNYRLNPANVADSVLIHGPGFLSDAGLGDDFKQIIEIPPTPVINDIPIIGAVEEHLAGQFNRVVVQTVLSRIAALKAKGSPT